MRLIDADELKKMFPDKGEGAWTYNITAKAYIDGAPTVDLWHYPSKGEYPPNRQEVLLCLHTEKGQEIVVGYRDTDSDLHEGGGHAWGWYDLGNNVLQDFADDSIKVVAWQYIIPPKEEA